MSRSSILASSFASIAVLAPAAFADVITVAPSGADYLEIYDGVLFAAEGDVVLVRAGVYQGFEIDGKSITVVADAGAQVRLTSPVRVANLASSQTVVLSGLDATTLPNGTPLFFESNDGRIRVQDVVANGASSLGPLSWPAVEVAVCADVAFAHCAFVGARAEHLGNGWSRPAQPSMVVFAGSISMYDSSATGARGLDGYYHGGMPLVLADGAPGRAGVELAHATSRFFARGSTFVGGGGGDGLATGLCPTTPSVHETDGGDGAPGIGSTGGSVSLVDVVATGGAGGVGGTNGCGGQAPSGVAAAPVEPPTTIQPDSSVAMQFVEPAREGAPITFVLSGPPGRRVILGTSPNAGLSVLSSGNLLLGTPMRRTPLGTIPASGTLTVQLPAPALPAGVEARVLHAQAVFVDPVSGQSSVSTPNVLVVLDSAL